MRMSAVALALVVSGSLLAQAPKGQAASDTAKKTPPGRGAVAAPNADPFPSTYRPFPSRRTLIRNATILTAAGPRIAGGSVLLANGKIVAWAPTSPRRLTPS